MKCHPHTAALCIPSALSDFDICIKGPGLLPHSGQKQPAGCRGRRSFSSWTVCNFTVISVCTAPGPRGQLTHHVCNLRAPSGSLASRPFQRRLVFEPVYKAWSYFCFVLAKRVKCCQQYVWNVIYLVHGFSCSAAHARARGHLLENARVSQFVFSAYDFLRKRKLSSCALVSPTLLLSLTLPSFPSCAASCLPFLPLS